MVNKKDQQHMEEPSWMQNLQTLRRNRLHQGEDLSNDHESDIHELSELNIPNVADEQPTNGLIYQKYLSQWQRKHQHSSTDTSLNHNHSVQNSHNSNGKNSSLDFDEEDDEMLSVSTTFSSARVTPSLRNMPPPPLSPHINTVNTNKNINGVKGSSTDSTMKTNSINTHRENVKVTNNSVENSKSGSLFKGAKRRKMNMQPRTMSARKQQRSASSLFASESNYLPENDKANSNVNKFVGSRAYKDNDMQGTAYHHHDHVEESAKLNNFANQLDLSSGLSFQQFELKEIPVVNEQLHQEKHSLENNSYSATVSVNENILLQQLMEKLLPHLNDAVTGIVKTSIQRHVSALVQELQHELPRELESVISDTLLLHLNQALDEIRANAGDGYNKDVLI
ncbi:MAG: hypothetical protein IK065_06215 [Neisseriaceae bacterium]|nr:hypothetical protein [Neisseriaceae bacterium]